MADTKPSAFPAVTSAAATDQFIDIPSGGTASKITFVNLRSSIGAGLSNASTGDVAGGYSSDTYLAGSALTIPVAGGWQAGSIAKWHFNMTKTAAGTATPIITIRMGTLGTTGDAAIVTLTFAAGTAVADVATFDVFALFRSVGSGTSAVLQGEARCFHHLAATGMTTTGASGIGNIWTTSSGFNSTTQTIIGLSFNGGTSFSGGNTVVWADADKL